MDDVSFRYSLDIGMKKKLKNFILKIGKMADQVGYVSENPNLVVVRTFKGVGNHQKTT